MTSWVTMMLTLARVPFPASCNPICTSHTSSCCIVPGSLACISLFKYLPSSKSVSHKTLGKQKEGLWGRGPKMAISASQCSPPLPQLWISTWGPTGKPFHGSIRSSAWVELGLGSSRQRSWMSGVCVRKCPPCSPHM